MRIVAVDPGETTGYAVYDTERQEVVESGELFGDLRTCVDFIVRLGELFVVEDFRVRPSAARGLSKHKRLWPVEWLGALRYLRVPMVLQTASQAKAVEPLRSASSPHEADALRHLRVYLGTGIATPDRVAQAIEEMMNENLSIQSNRAGPTDSRPSVADLALDRRS